LLLAQELLLEVTQEELVILFLQGLLEAVAELVPQTFLLTPAVHTLVMAGVMAVQLMLLAVQVATVAAEALAVMQVLAVTAVITEVVAAAEAAVAVAVAAVTTAEVEALEF
jgi:hypothetical protein